MEQLTQGGSRPLADDQLQRAWINDLIIESGTPLSIEDIDAELDRYALYRAEQAPKRPYRVEDSELQLCYVVLAIRDRGPIDLRQIADNLRKDMSDEEIKRALDVLIERDRVTQEGEMYTFTCDLPLTPIPGRYQPANPQ